MVLGALCWAFAAGAQPIMYQLMGKGVAANNWTLGDTVSARPATTNATVTVTPARNFTGQNVILVQTVDYPLSSGQAANLNDSKGNTYVNVLTVFGATLNQRIRHWICYNPDVSGGGVTLTYSSTGGVANFPVVYAQGFSGVTASPTWATNSVTSIANIASIGTGSVTTTSSKSVLVSTVATQNNINVVSSASGSMTNTDLMSWRPFTTGFNQYSASYARIMSAAGTYSVTHTTNGANFNTQSVSTIVVYN